MEEGSNSEGEMMGPLATTGGEGGGDGGGGEGGGLAARKISKKLIKKLINFYLSTIF